MNHNRIDLMSWVDDLSKISNDDDRSKASDQFIHVVMTAGTLDPGGSVQKSLRDAIFRQLSTEDRLGSGTKRDSINETFNSWLLGGVIHDGVSPCRIQSAEIMGDNLVISYTGPQLTFQPPIPAAWPSGFDFSPGALANIDHIVVLTMENRSFDHMLGYLSLPTFKGGMGRTDIDGLKGTEFNLLNGVKVPSFALPPGDTIFSPDPPHGFEPVHQAINGGKMDGFVTSCAQEHGPAAGPLIMGYHTAANVPIYDAMARDFAICNRWFASHPGPTFSNRFYEVTGRLNIDPLGFWEVNNSSPLRPVFTPTIFDHLSDQKVSWKYFEQHYCFLRFFEQHTFDSANIATFDDPEFGFEALARSGNLPGVTFIDPHFIELPPTANSNEPPANIADGQLFEQRVVNAVVSSPAWNKTLLIITYDEHGGFFDHVPPPAATPVSPESIGTYGVRVPAFVVSPWVRAGSTFGTDADDVHVGGGGTVGGVATTHADIPVSPPVPIKSPLVSLHFDHTSILKTIAKRFLSANPPYMGARYADAHDVGVTMGSQLTSSQFLPFIPYNFVYGTSKMGLEVKAASADAVLFQDTPNTTPAQQFSFEDAGGGFVYIRTHMGNQYVTSIPAVAGAQAAGIRQEAKYPPGGPATQNPDFQRWKLTSTGATVASANIFTITNAAVPGMVLQPSGNSLVAGIPVLLGVPVVSHLGIGVNPNGWQVTSPLLPNTQNTVKH
jgi:phospholipase C